MPFTLVGWHEDIDAATLNYIAALEDPHVTVSGDDIIVPPMNRLMGVFAIGPNMTQARVESPSLRRLALLDVAPTMRQDVPGKHAHTENLAASYTQNATTADATSAEPADFFYDLFDRPIELDVSETIQAKVAEDAVGTSRCTVLVWLGDEIEPAPEGRLIVVRATASKTLTPYVWTNAALTFSQSLPAGRYAIVGFRAQSTNLIAARLVIPALWHRPGTVAVGSPYAPDVPRFRFGRAGNWGEFEHNLPPTVDFLAAAADTSQVVHLDLIQVRAGAA